MLHEVSTRPFQKIGLVIAEWQPQKYLIVCDYYSKWIDILPSRTGGVTEVISNLRKLFAHFGIPEIVFGDNVPFNSREFREIAQQWDFDLVFRSPGFPQ